MNQIYTNPDIRVEQIMSMAIAAQEAIQADFFLYPENRKLYDIALLPYGPEIYTGVLLAAGVLLLKKKKQNLTIIYEQTHNENDLVIYEGPCGPYMGKIYNQKENNEAIKMETEKIPVEVETVLEYIRVLGDSSKITLIGKGTLYKNKTYFQRISLTTTNVIIMGNLSVNKEYESGKKIDEQCIEKCIDNTSKDKIELILPNMISIFDQFTKKKKLSPDIVGYVNTGDFGGQKKKTSGYGCLVA